MNPQHGHFPASQVSGHGRPRPERGHSRRGHGRGHGLPTDSLRMRMRSRTGRGHGPVADWPRPRIGHGLPVAMDISAAIWSDRLRFHRDYFADAKTSFSRGVRRVSSKTGRLQPCGCQRAASSTQADWITFRMQFDTLTGHFPFRQCCHPLLESRVCDTPARSLFSTKSAVYEW